jgi:hypothetical protein
MLKKFKELFYNAFSKKDKPIITKEQQYILFKLKSNRTDRTDRTVNILAGLSDINKQHIGKWLDSVEVKKDEHGEPYIESPFKGSIYIYKDVSYVFLYRWCADNFERKRLAKLPKLLDIFIYYTYYANKWKKNPKVNPYTNERMPISLNPNGEYVRVYKQIMDGLIVNILNTKTKKESLSLSSGKILSIEDCYKLKDSLPNEHTGLFLDEGSNTYKIHYDYLFIAYFIKSKASIYDPAFQSELGIYIDLAVYNTSQFEYIKGKKYTDLQYTTLFLYESQFYRNYLLNTGDSELSINNLILRLCIDIDNTILRMSESKETKITKAMIDKIIFNMEVLKYCKEIFSKVPFNYFLEYIKNPKNKSDKVLLKEYLLNVLTNNVKNIPEGHKAIYNSIMDYMRDVEEYEDDVFGIPVNIRSHEIDVFETLLSIYNSILKLYKDNKKNTNYEPIKERTNIDKGVEPQVPRKPQLTQDLQKYKMLSSLKGSVKDDEKERKLKEHQEKEKAWEKQLKDYDYDKKKDIYDRIYEGKVSAKPNKHMWNGESFHVSRKKYKDDNNIKVVKALSAKYPKQLKAHHTSTGRSDNYSTSSSPKVSFVKYDRTTGAFIKSLGAHPRITDKESYYVNEYDPYTQDEFRKMTPKKQKYASVIVYNDGKKEYHYRFDTVSIYNYILNCIEVCEKPINIFNRVELTDADLDEICKKIKHFTKKPTYNLSSEIKPLLLDCSKYYYNYLEFVEVEDIKTEDLEKTIIGSTNIYITIRLGDINFKIIEKEVLKLPIFKSNEYMKLLYHILQLLQAKLTEGMFITRRFFPYRKNEPILNLPNFPFGFNDNANKTLERLEKYVLKIEQM